MLISRPKTSYFDSYFAPNFRSFSLPSQTHALVRYVRGQPEVEGAAAFALGGTEEFNQSATLTESDSRQG